jgi:hypothetical protein
MDVPWPYVLVLAIQSSLTFLIAVKKGFFALSRGHGDKR